MKLTAKNLGRRYERSGRPFWAVRGANLTVDSGDFVSVLGRSGSGKTTLLTMLLGLLTPTEGEVTIGGTQLASLTDKEMSALRNRSVGYVPQHAGLVPTLSILDNVRLPWHLANHRGDEPAGRAQKLLDDLGIGELAGLYPKALSGGELRRTAVARALMNSPGLIVADEPTSNLDRESAGLVLDVLKNARSQGAGVLIVTHDTLSLDASNAVYEMAGGILNEHSR